MTRRIKTILLCVLGASATAAAPAVGQPSGGVGCHPEWPVVVHHAGGQVAAPPAGEAMPIACAVQTGYATSETSLAATPDGTLVFSPAQTENSVARSTDGGATWSLAYPASEQYTSLWNTVDPDVIADPRTGRVFWVHATGDLRTTAGVTENSPLPNSIQTIVAYAHGFQVYSSSNDGRDFTTADYHNEQMGDWEKIFTGPPASPASGAPQPTGYPDVVYVCANSPFEVSGPGRMCYRSLDGGATFSMAGFVFPSASAPADVCPSLASNAGVVGSDGSTYQPVSCHQGAYVAVSHDEGTSYSWERVKDAPPASGFSGSLQLAIDPADNLYGLWLLGSDDLYLAVSRDHGKTWGTPLKVTAPGVHTITRPAFAAGGAGQVAITYYASRDPKAQTLTAYITQTANALAPQPLFYSGALNDPAHPIYVDAGLTGGSPRADFIGGAYDSAGTFWAGLVKQFGPRDANGNYATTGYVGHLAFLGQAAGAATPVSSQPAGCVAASRLSFRISPVPHGRVVKVLAYVNGRLRASRRGRSLTRVSFARPSGRRLVVRIVTVNNRGGRVVTVRTFTGCTRTRVTGKVHRARATGGAKS